MTARLPSLRRRLLVITLVWTLLSVALAGWGIQRLFRQHILAQLQSELSIHLDHLTAAVQVDDQGQVSLATEPTDPRFIHPYSGLYWQISVPAGNTRFAQVLRSRSLWDVHLPDMLDAPPPGQDVVAQIVGPGDRPLRVRLREVHPAEGPVDTLFLAVAADEALWAEPIGRFDRMLAVALGILALGMVVAAWMQVGFGLRPLARLRGRLSDLREGRADRIEGEFPLEVQPLVEDFNQVLSRTSEGLERARMQAGNLAHALKTPLAVMANAAQAEDPALPRLVMEQVDASRRQVDYYLARTRAAAAVRVAGLRSPILPLLQGLVRVMDRVHADRGLHYELSGLAEDLVFRGEAQDFQEMLGNVLDNAGKWARTRVRVTAVRRDGELAIHVDDDGPGLDPERAEAVFERGQRADERTPGSGLGLGIVRDLAYLYGGWARIERSDLGGARVVITLPAA